MSERHTSTRTFHKYFGPGAPFDEACGLYQSGGLPADVLKHAESLDKSRIAFSLGYAFATVLKRREMRITGDDLQQISWMKISYGNPEEFVNGFRLFQSQDTV